MPWNRVENSCQKGYMFVSPDFKKGGSDVSFLTSIHINNYFETENFLNKFISCHKNSVYWACYMYRDKAMVSYIKGTQSLFYACARVWFLFRRSRIQRCENWYRAFTNPFASSSINFGFALTLLRIKDQWHTVLVKCQFVCNRDLSVLTSMPFGWTSSGGKCYGAERRRLSPAAFSKV